MKNLVGKRSENRYGRLIIPSLLISVSLYHRIAGTNGQDIVDAVDSAVIWEWNRLTMIADHASQANFNRLSRVRTGKAKAYICKSLSTDVYVCDSAELGHIRLSDSGNRLYDSKWRPVHEVMHDGLCIYTCKGKSAVDVMDVYLTHWKRV